VVADGGGTLAACKQLDGGKPRFYNEIRSAPFSITNRGRSAALRTP